MKKISSVLFIIAMYLSSCTMVDVKNRCGSKVISKTDITKKFSKHDIYHNYSLFIQNEKEGTTYAVIVSAKEYHHYNEGDLIDCNYPADAVWPFYGYIDCHEDD